MAPRTAIPWEKDIDAALARARTSRRTVFVDFNAAPM